MELKISIDALPENITIGQLKELEKQFGELCKIKYSGEDKGRVSNSHKPNSNPADEDYAEKLIEEVGEK